MLRSDVIDLLNSGSAWAFLGSGVSIDSGAPTWETLAGRFGGQINPSTGMTLSTDQAFAKAMAGHDYPRALSRVEAVFGRAHLEGEVAQSFAQLRGPGTALRLVADWPFHSYVTMNYDPLLESALEDVGARGWVPVGNTDDEIRKIGGGPPGVVWHPHGALGISDSSLVLTTEDYESLYLEDSAVSRQLAAVLGQSRMVFFGFGFQDQEMLRMIRRVGRLSNPAMPIIAFLPDLAGPSHQSDVDELLARYNVDVVHYNTVNGSHEHLSELLTVYKSFTLTRSLTFNDSPVEAPSFDPETTSLLIYNRLCLQSGKAVVSDEILRILLRARVLSLLKHRGALPRSELLADLDARAAALKSHGQTVGFLDSVVGDLKTEDLVAELPTGDPTFSLTQKGSGLVDDLAAKARLLGQQFAQSLDSRARSSDLTDQGALRVAAVAESFFKDVTNRRALGVAMAMDSPHEQAQSYHMVGLLRALPQFMTRVVDEHEAVALSHVVQDVLARPTPAEKQFLGLALQAQFGVHLLGADPVSIDARAKELQGTVFLLDSSLLIPYLARSSVGYDASRMLVSLLARVGSRTAATFLLAVEVAEHARWAINQLHGERLISTPGLKASTGRAGSRSNAFLDGLLHEASLGKESDLMHYLRDTCYLPPGARSCADTDIQQALDQEGIPCQDFQDFEGFDDELLVNREELSSEIERLRRERDTFRHERQTRAEAEACLLVQGLRRQQISIDEQVANNAFFVSNTRVIDTAAGAGSAITIRPEAVLQWINALVPSPVEELSALTSLLRWELADRGVDIVDSQRLRLVFSPLVNASAEKLGEEVARHRALVTSEFGEASEAAFREASPLDTPIVLEGFYAQLAEKWAGEAKAATLRATEAEKRRDLTEAERGELEKLRQRRAEKHQKAIRRQRAAKSRKGKGRGRRKR